MRRFRAIVKIQVEADAWLRSKLAAFRQTVSMTSCTTSSAVAASLPSRIR